MTIPIKLATIDSIKKIISLNCKQVNLVSCKFVYFYNKYLVFKK